MGISALSQLEIQAGLQKLTQWKQEGKEIVKTYELPTFVAALDWVSWVGQYAESVDHHPDIFIQYRNVTLKLSTHDANGLSTRDFSFAAAVDTAFSQRQKS